MTPGMMSAYHLALAYVGAYLYGNPSHYMLVIAVTGTKGKSSTTELVNAIFEKAGAKTALLNSIRIKIADKSEPNTMRMSMPGRFYIQKFLAKAKRKGCGVAILEMTSEGARQHRQRAVEMDALIFTNLSPEHIESHGSYQQYADAKFMIGQQLARSPKHPRTIVANIEDPESRRYITLPVERVIPFSLKDVEHAADERGGYFMFNGERIDIHLPGDFSLRNALAAATLCSSLGISTEDIKAALGAVQQIAGRGQRIEEGQDFAVVVDYAHTPDSLQALYDAYKTKKRICVLGSTGGGRDMWKRPAMGKIADDNCDHIILTNEDPYDEDPRSIIDSLARGMQKQQPEIILDRREAIAKALAIAKPDDAVLITGKGTDPTIQIAGGKSIPWSDAQVVREELKKLRQV